MTVAEPVEVRLLGVPVDLWRRAAQHQEGIEREFAILRASAPDDSVPHRLQALVDQLEGRFADFGEHNRRLLQDAADRGDDSIDLVYRLPAEAGEAAARLDAMLDEVEAYCREGDLLTLATPEPLVEFRRWLLGEFVRQVGGAPPLSWDEHASATDTSPAPETAGPAGTAESAGVLVVEDDVDLATVGTLRNRIQQAHQDGVQRLTLDLTSVAFIDSVGIGLLVTTRNRFHEEGRELRLLAGPRLRSVLRLAGVETLFDLEPA